MPTETTAPKTLILGATPNPSRYAYRAAHMLTSHAHEIVPVGIKSGEVAGAAISNDRTPPAPGEVDTITLYIGPQHQAEWEEYILAAKPRRLIFNPGTENPTLAQKAQEAGIEPVYACTLVMLSTGQY